MSLKSFRDRSIPGRLRLAILLVSAACGSGIGTGSTAAQEGVPPDPHEVVLSGIFTIGDERLAALELKADDRASSPTVWKREGEEIGHYTVAEVQEERVVLRRTIRDDAATAPDLVISIQHAHIVPLGHGVAPSDRMTAAQMRWINSEDNPMFRQPRFLFSIPGPRWPDLSAEEKRAIQRWYWDHGWKFSASALDQGLTEFRFENLFEDYRRKLHLEGHRLFRESLSGEQRRLQKDLSAFIPEGKTSVRHDDLSEADRARLDALNAQFEASISPEQRELRRMPWYLASADSLPEPGPAISPPRSPPPLEDVDLRLSHVLDMPPAAAEGDPLDWDAVIDRWQTLSDQEKVRAYRASRDRERRVTVTLVGEGEFMVESALRSPREE